MSEQCDECGTELIDNCMVCGAPVCCPRCCERDHLNKRIAELKGLCRESFQAIGAFYSGIGWEREVEGSALLFRLNQISEGGGDAEDRLIKKLLNEPQSLRTAKILIKEIVSLKGGTDE